jgi:hypothetical protein
MRLSPFSFPVAASLAIRRSPIISSRKKKHADARFGVFSQCVKRPAAVLYCFIGKIVTWALGKEVPHAVILATTEHRSSASSWQRGAVRSAK